MSVTNGQDADETTFNDAFVSKTTDSTTVGKINLNNSDTASGSTVTNVQREINSLDSFTGRSAGSAKDVKPTWSNNNVGGSTDDLKTRVDSLTERFDEISGHTHDGTDGNGGPLVDADASTAGIVTTASQQFSGDKTFNDKLISDQELIIQKLLSASEETNSSLTGSSADLSSHTSSVVRLTNASLTSIRGVTPLATGDEFLVLINATGAGVNILHEAAGGTAAYKFTNPNSSDIYFPDKAILMAVYDSTTLRWRVINGGSSFTLGNLGGTDAKGLTYSNGVLTLCEASGSTGGAVSTGVQSFGGDKVFGGSVTVTRYISLAQANYNSTASDVDNSGNRATSVRMINAGQTQVRSLTKPTTPLLGTTIPAFVMLHNITGVTLTVLNNSGTAPADSGILTGTNADMSLANNASLLLVYDVTTLRWRVVGGSGGSGSSGLTNATAAGNTIALTVGWTMMKIRWSDSSPDTLGLITNPADGMVMYLVGTSDTNTLTINNNDTSNGWIVNGTFVLGLNSCIQLVYDSTLARWLEVSRRA